MILDLFKLDGKVALVTGSGRGLGQGMAIALAQSGADVAGLDVISQDETAAQVQALGRRFLPVSANLLAAHADDMTKVVNEVVSGLGRLDILARYSWPGNVRELENFMERMSILCEGDRIGLTCAP